MAWKDGARSAGYWQGESQDKKNANAYDRGYRKGEAERLQA